MHMINIVCTRFILASISTTLPNSCVCVCVSGGESDGDSIEDLRVSSLEYSVSLSLSDELQLTVQHHIPPGHLHSVVETGHSYVCTSKITFAYYIYTYTGETLQPPA